MPPGFLFWLALIALAALVSVVVTLDPAGDAPFLMQGPGVTLDEPLNVRPGLYHWRLLWDHGVGFWDPSNTKKFFGDPNYLADYPPWGRIVLGFWHDVTLPFLAPADHPGPDVLVCARVGSAITFALTVFVCGLAAQRWFGGCAGVMASLCVTFMPRLWAHAHIASIETVLNLAYTLVVVAVGSFWARHDADHRGVKLRWAILAGLLWGFALLTKLQAVFLPFPLILWAFCVWRWRAIVPLAVFGVVGMATFYLGWPWLWLDPQKNIVEYFARSTERITIDCFYWGREWADRDVPWHYPWVMFAVTVPLGWHILAMIGGAAGFNPAVRGVETQRRWLLLLNIVFPLIIFTIPGVPVYDGERLFLVAYPLWAILAGAGAERCRKHLVEVRQWSRLRAAELLGMTAAAQMWGLIALHPCQLNHYNILTGGLRGASRMGFETCYWGDSVCREFLSDVVKEVPEGATIDVAPVMHYLQLEELHAQSPLLRERKITLRAFDDRHIDDVRYALVFRRRADPWESLEHPPPGAKLLVELSREGVQLAALYEFER
jgi:hypothetical protein